MTHATRISYLGKIANKGNTKAIVVPLEVMEEMGLEVGDRVQITIERLPRE